MVTFYTLFLIPITLVGTLAYFQFLVEYFSILTI